MMRSLRLGMWGVCNASTLVCRGRSLSVCPPGAWWCSSMLCERRGWRWPSVPTKRAGRCQRSSTASPPVTMPSRSSRATAERFSCLPTSTRTGKRPSTSSGHLRTPGVFSTHTNRLSRALALEPDRIAGALEGPGVQIGDKGAPVSPVQANKRWNHAVFSRRFCPVLGLCVRFGHRGASRW